MPPQQLTEWRLEQVEEELKALRKLLVKVLISITGACLLLLANLLLKGKVG